MGGGEHEEGGGAPRGVHGEGDCRGGGPDRGGQDVVREGCEDAAPWGSERQVHRHCSRPLLRQGRIPTARWKAEPRVVFFQAERSRSKQFPVARSAVLNCSLRVLSRAPLLLRKR